MPYTTITPPTVGDPTRKSLIDAVIDNLDFLNTEVARLGGASLVKNGSFENSTGGIPDGWDVNTYLSGAAGLTGNGLGDTNCIHGARAHVFISVGGGGSFGGGYVETLDFFQVTPQRPLLLTWQWYSTAATVCNKVEVKWYTAAQALISTTTVANVSTGNPTAWRQEFGTAVPPATARFAKLKLIGCDPSSATAGATYFDDVYVTDQELRFMRSVEFDAPTAGTSATYRWTSPATAGLARVTLWGGGGSGGGAANGQAQGGGGGGGGQMVRGMITYAASTVYTIVCGYGAVASAVDTAGTAGADSTFASTSLVAKAGAGGARGATGTGGAGGTSGTGMEQYDGTAGQAGEVSLGQGGMGGHSVRGPSGGAGGIAADGSAPIAPRTRGAGGGGGGVTGASKAGGAGGGGGCVIEY